MIRRVGLIGGVSPESTIVYYRHLNRAAEERLGAGHSAPLSIDALDFGAVHEAYAAEDWQAFEEIVASAALRLEAAGCEAVAITSNTSHLTMDAVAEAVSIPLISLFDAVRDRLQEIGASRPLLLGTPFVMTGPFYRRRLREVAEVDCIVPDEADRAEIDRIIFEELVRNDIRGTSRDAYLAAIERSRAAGADAVILGCTEIPLMLDARHTDLPIVDTTAAHAARIARFAFGR